MRHIVIGTLVIVGIAAMPGALCCAQDAPPAAHVDVNAPIRDWRYVLTIHEIAQADDAERLSQLINDNPDRALARLPDGRTTVHCAAEAGALKSLRILAKAGCDLNTWDDKKRTPLSMAINANYLNTVKTLVELGADVNKEGLADGDVPERPLVVAARRGNVAVLKILLDAKVDANQLPNGTTALLTVAASGWTDALNLLLDHGADANVKDNDGSTALIYAAKLEDQSAVAALLAHGADPKMANKRGRRPLDLTETPSIWKLLVDKGADANVMVGDVTRLQYYIAQGNEPLVKAWLEYRPDPFVVDRQGHTAKELARKYADESANPDTEAARQAIVTLLVGYQRQYAADLAAHEGVK